jgi:hypothetical protein
MLAKDLLGFELAVEGFEDPVLEDVAVARLDVAEDEADAGGTMVEDDSFSFERFTGIVNLEEQVAFQFEGGTRFDKAALKAEFGDTSGEHRFGRVCRGDFGGCIERKS